MTFQWCNFIEIPFALTTWLNIPREGPKYGCMLTPMPFKEYLLWMGPAMCVCLCVSVTDVSVPKSLDNIRLRRSLQIKFQHKFIFQNMER